MLSKQITQLRKKAGMSQSQLASQLSVSPSTIGMYEQGRRTPDLSTLISMATCFGVSLDYLITGSEAIHREGRAILQSQWNCPCCAVCFRAQKLSYELQCYMMVEEQTVKD